MCEGARPKRRSPSHTGKEESDPNIAPPSNWFNQLAVGARFWGVVVRAEGFNNGPPERPEFLAEAPSNLGRGGHRLRSSADGISVGGAISMITGKCDNFQGFCPDCHIPTEERSPRVLQSGYPAGL